jgi:uncharacterized protein
MARLELSEIWIYPIKSLGGIRLRSSKIAEKGFVHDRRWMLVDEKNTFLSQRSHPALALFKLKIQSDTFVVSYQNDTITLPTNSKYADLEIKATVWDDTVTTYEVSTTHSNWFSEKLGMTCKLVVFPEENPRPIDQNYAIKNNQVSLADGYPILAIGQSSLDDLNKKLEKPVPMDRFRPNLVFTGGQPYEEDFWKEFIIGRNKFIGVKPCSRCVLTTIDQATGEQGKEPLATLASYRKNNNKIYFGQNVLPIDYHEINEGDEIKLL